MSVTLSSRPVHNTNNEQVSVYNLHVFLHIFVEPVKWLLKQGFLINGPTGQNPLFKACIFFIPNDPNPVPII